MAINEFKAGQVIINDITYDIMATITQNGRAVQISADSLLATQERINTFAQALINKVLETPDLDGRIIQQINSTHTTLSGENSSIDHTEDVQGLWNQFSSELLQHVRPEANHVHIAVNYSAPQFEIRASRPQNALCCTVAATEFASNILMKHSTRDFSSREIAEMDTMLMQAEAKHAEFLEERRTHEEEGLDSESATVGAYDAAQLYQDDLISTETYTRNAQMLPFDPEERKTLIQGIFDSYEAQNGNCAGTITANGKTYGIAVLKQENEYLVYDSHGING
ncbi:MAG: hypothetical protein KAR79_04975, partial [Simkaniaceae bacterium]|nr:hypothetical protein [Simkaniaceae bacterium]